MTNRIVSNTGPLIALALIERLDLLQSLYHEIIIPRIVHEELLQRGEEAPGVAAYLQATWIQKRELFSPVELSLLATLDSGEASVIQLARDCHIQHVLIDERKGRKVARVIYQLDVIGTAGILVKAKRHGLVNNIREALLGMRTHGYYLHDRIVELALKEAREV
jgi:predicted nucleic acid-binding protein